MDRYTYSLRVSIYLVTGDTYSPRVLSLQYLEQQTARAEEERQEKHRQQAELDRLAAIKAKSKEEQSAVASTEVKQLLQDLIRKKQAAAAQQQQTCGNGVTHPRNWWVVKYV